MDIPRHRHTRAIAHDHRLKEHPVSTPTAGQTIDSRPSHPRQRPSLNGPNTGDINDSMHVFRLSYGSVPFLLPNEMEEPLSQKIASSFLPMIVPMVAVPGSEVSNSAR
ncbi:MAG: hypothetical protein ABFC89_13520 [Methanospirillum sp.]